MSDFFDCIAHLIKNILGKKTCAILKFALSKV